MDDAAFNLIELWAGIRGKLTPAKTALELLSKAKEVPKEFLEMAHLL